MLSGKGIEVRIIDKNTDYYDYLQNYDDPLVFDRRGSYLLTKEKLCHALGSERYYLGGVCIHMEKEKYRYVLLQCGATFWLILVNVTEYDEAGFPLKYGLELLTTWKNYNKPSQLLQLTEIDFHYDTYVRNRKQETERDRIQANITRMIDAINNNDLFHTHNLNGDKKYTDYKGRYKCEIMDIPILSACGIANIIDPVDIFTAIEEHFSLLKTESERIDPIGATNDDKITMHGFDTKTSFRNNK